MKRAKQQSAVDTVNAALVLQYARLWRYASSLSRNQADADDLVQSTVLRALQQAHMYQEQDKVDRWLFTIMRRIWLNNLRAQKVRRGSGVDQIEVLDLEDDRPNIETSVFAREILSKVMTLPDPLRTAVVLVSVEGFNCREAAAFLGIASTTFSSRLSRARAELSGFASDERQAE